jgi:hypothetical protein
MFETKTDIIAPWSTDEGEGAILVNMNPNFPV